MSHLFPWMGPEATMISWGYAWWLVGVFCIVNAFRRDDRWGYGMAIGVKISWVLALVFAWYHGLVGGAGSVVLWLFVLGMALALAFRGEPVGELDQLTRQVAEHLPHREDHDDDSEF